MGVPLRIPVAACAALTVLLNTSPSDAREWVNDQGKKLEASFVRLRDDTAFLRADGKLIRAPLDRLSEADQQWITRHEELAAARAWGTAGVTGPFIAIRTEGFEIRTDDGRQTVPFAELTADDYAIVAEYHTHIERELPDRFAAEQTAAIERAPPPRPEGMVERNWTDTRGRELTAEFEGTVDQKALLWRGDKRFDFPLTKLIAEDRAWIARHYLDQLADDLGDGVSAANSIVSAGMMKAMMSGRRPPSFPPPSPQAFAKPPAQAAPSPDAFVETDSYPEADAQPTSTPAPTSETTSVHPERGSPPWIDDVNDFSNNEIDARYREAFGEWVDTDEGIGGDAYCSHCQGEFVYPESFAVGGPCPFCGIALKAEDLDDWGDIDEGSSGGGLWFLRRGPRRIILFLLITAIGAGIKLTLGGGEE